MKQPTYKVVRELFDYFENDKTGYLRWKVDISDRVKTGDVAGCGTGNYWLVRFYGVLYKLHRIIFLWHHGYLPELVDHDDRDTLNNKIDNLRDVSYQCNSRNCKIPTNNTSGVKGVYWFKIDGNWESKMKINGKSIYLGRFPKFEDAVKARYRKELEVGWKGCNSTSSAYLYLKENGILPKKILKLKYRSQGRRQYFESV
jgi:hypothetical protein